MLLSKVNHKGVVRIKVEFAYDVDLVSKLKRISDARWSKTLKAWHVPYTVEVWKELKAQFSGLTLGVPTKEEPGETVQAVAKGIVLEVTGRRIIIKMARNDADIAFVKSLRYSSWNKKDRFWWVPHYGSNLEVLKNYFGDRLSSIEIAEQLVVAENTNQERSISRNAVLIIRTVSGRLKIIFGHAPNLQKYLKELPYRTWDTVNKWWTVPYTEAFLSRIKAVVIAGGGQVIYEEEDPAAGKPKRNNHSVPNYRKMPQEYLDKLRELRYSETTIKTYSNSFEEFINFYSKIEIDRIDEKKIIAYLRYLVMERTVSSSYQNQAINAIKFYYEKVLGGQRKLYHIDRPRTEKTLPTVFSNEEVCLILKHTANLKHKAMLMTCYSAGLRVSELLNLKISDVDGKRKQIRVQQGKGKKDRYTLLAEKTLLVLREYVKAYQPKEWLFEGYQGDQYSSRSLQIILKNSLKAAGIIKKASMHTLRHTFATHLLESGTDLRYIQSLLGHGSSKTTEIYTHVTTKGFDKIKSPLDNLDL